MDALKISKFRFGVEFEMNEEMNRAKLQPNWIYKNEHCGSEITSPPLSGYLGLLQVRRQIETICKQFNTLTFKEAGFHLHVDIQHFNLGNAKRLFLLAQQFNEVLFAMMEGSRWENEYCRQLKFNEKDILNLRTIKQLIDYQGDRFYALNFHAFRKFGTVEFRYAMSTMDWQILYSLISMFLRMIAFSETDRVIVSCKNSGLGKRKFHYGLKKIKILLDNKELFFDLLEIKGKIREILSNMFDRNVLCMSNPKAYTARDCRVNVKFKKGLRRKVRT